MTRPKQPRSTSGIPPQTAQTILNLLDRNQWDQVEPLLIKLRQKHGDDFRLLVWHGDTLRGLERFPEAITLYRQALELEPQNNESLTLSLAMCLRKEGQLDEALRLSGQVIQLRPDYAGAWALQGDIYKDQELLTQARDAYLEALKHAAAPLNALLYVKLAPFTPLPPEPAILQALEAFTNEAEQPINDRANVLATLGKIWLDAQEPDKAFEYYRKANNLIKGAFTTPPKSLIPQVNGLRVNFTAELFKALSPFGVQSAPQIFITGFSRSGKSLVESLFRSAANVRLTGESLQLDLYRQNVLTRFQNNLENYLTAQTPSSIQQDAHTYLSTLKNDGKVNISTLPSDLWNLGFIGLWLPKAPIIFCVRGLLDLGATVYCQQYKSFEGNHYSYDLPTLGEHIALYEHMMAHWAQVLPNPVFLVDYEALVRDPQTVMDNLFEQLGLERQQSYTDTVAANASMASEIGPINSFDAAMPMTDRFIGFGERFREQLTPMVQRYQSTCQELAQEQPANMVDLPAQLKVRNTEPDSAPAEADFSWLLSQVITIADNSSHLLRQQKAQDLVESGACTLLSFDPSGELAPLAQALDKPSLHYLPQALLGDGQPSTLYLALDAAYNSTLPPAANQPGPAYLAQKNMTLAQLPVTTYALDAIEGLDWLDYLILDGVYDHATILEHGSQRLSNALLIQVSVALVATQQGQTDLATVLQWADQHGFRLLRLIDEQLEQHMPARPDLALQPAGSQLRRASVLLVPSYQRQAQLSPTQILKQAFLLDTVHDIHDFSYELLLQIDPTLAERYLKARGYLEPKRHGPDLREIQHIRQMLHTSDLPVPRHQTRKWVEQYPADPLVQSLYAECLSWSGHHRSAILTIQEAISKAPDELVLRQTYIDIMNRAGMWWEAIDLARALHVRYPERQDVQAQWWSTLTEQARPDAQEVNEALSRSQIAAQDMTTAKQIEHHATRGRLLAHSQQWEQAWQEHEQALLLAQNSQGPELARPLIAKADSLYEAGLINESCEHLWQACATYRYSPYTVHAYRKLNARLPESTQADLQSIAALHQKIEQIWAGYKQDNLQYAFGDFGLPYQGFEPLKLAGSRPAMQRLETYGLQELLPAHASALDIGCNHGFLLMGLAPRLSYGLGFDISQSCIDVGKAVAEHLGHKHIELSSQPFDDFKSKQRFDLVIACAVHHWIGVPLSEFGTKLFNFCKPGGLVLLESQGTRETTRTEVDFEAKATTMASAGFTVIRKGSLCDDGINYREFWILQRKK